MANKRKQLAEFLRTGRPTMGLYQHLKQKGKMPKKPAEQGPKFRTLPIKPKDKKPKRKPPKRPLLGNIQ